MSHPYGRCSSEAQFQFHFLSFPLASNLVKCRKYFARVLRYQHRYLQLDVLWSREFVGSLVRYARNEFSTNTSPLFTKFRTGAEHPRQTPCWLLRGQGQSSRSKLRYWRTWDRRPWFKIFLELWQDNSTYTGRPEVLAWIVTFDKIQHGGLSEVCILWVVSSSACSSTRKTF